MIAGQGNLIVPLAMFGWIPAVSLFFHRLKPQLAASVSFCAAWMFLPEAKFPLKGLPDLTKITVSCIGIVMASYVFDSKRLESFRVSAVDLPIMLWCSSPLLSSLANGLGAYDGISESMYQSFTWGLPYFVSRMYFNNLEGLEILGKTVFWGGIIYIPLCVIEMVMSPQLHRITYGFHQHSFLQTIKGNGFRPMVYMEHGLMVAMWMVTASLLGLGLLHARKLPRAIFGIPSWVLVLGLVLITSSLRSMGALVLMMIALVGVWLSIVLKTRLIALVLLLIPPTYMMTRINGWWTGEGLVQFIAEKVSPERAQSLEFRLDNENILIDRALEAGLFGWGGWGRSRVFDEDGKDISVTDGLWIITLGTRGVYGLTFLNIAIVLPLILFFYRYHPDQWKRPDLRVPAVFLFILLIYMTDNLLNAMVNPVFMLFNGGLNSCLIQPEQPRNRSPLEDRFQWVHDYKLRLVS